MAATLPEPAERPTDPATLPLHQSAAPHCSRSTRPPLQGPSLPPFLRGLGEAWSVRLLKGRCPPAPTARGEPLSMLPATVSKEFVFFQNSMYRASGRPVGLGPAPRGEPSALGVLNGHHTLGSAHRSWAGAWTAGRAEASLAGPVPAERAEAKCPGLPAGSTRPRAMVLEP